MRREEGGVNQHDAVRRPWRKTPALQWIGHPRPFAGPLALAAMAVLAAMSGALPLAGQGGSFYTVPPCRLVDTRNAAGPFGAPGIPAAGVRAFDAAGQCGISTRALAISANVTVVAAPVPGYLVLGPAGAAMPSASTLNFAAGQTRANNAVVELGTAGAFLVAGRYLSSPANVIVDVNGYFANAGLEQGTAAPPAFNPPPGSYLGGQQVQILSSTLGAQI